MPVPVSGPRTMTAPDFMRSSNPSVGFALRTSNSVPVTAMSNRPTSTCQLAYGRCLTAKDAVPRVIDTVAPLRAAALDLRGAAGLHRDHRAVREPGLHGGLPARLEEPVRLGHRAVDRELDRTRADGEPHDEARCRRHREEREADGPTPSPRANARAGERGSHLGRQRAGRRVRPRQGVGQEVADPQAALLESLVLVLHDFTTRRGSSPSA